MKTDNALCTKSEKRAINAAVCLYLILCAAAIFLMISANDKTIRNGAAWLYGEAAAALAALGSAAAYIVLYVKRLRHIKPCKTHCTVVLAAAAIIAACLSYFAFECAADIFGGAHEITTDEYNIYDDTEFHFADGEKTAYVFVPKDVGAQIAEVPLAFGNDGAAVGESGLVIRAESVHIKYYPHTKVIVSVEKISE